MKVSATISLIGQYINVTVPACTFSLMKWFNINVFGSLVPNRIFSHGYGTLVIQDSVLSSVLTCR